MSVAPEAAHTHHVNADSTVEFNGMAAFTKEGTVHPWSYNPPKLADDFVEITISHCGICGSDLHTITSGWGPANYPVIPGHEIIGHIAAVGSKVTHVKVGDRVGVGAQCDSCLNANKDCPECESGWQQHCRQALTWTYNTKKADGQVTQGGYAEKVRCRGDFAFLIPDAIDSASAAPLMCAGATVYAPLLRFMDKPDMNVAVIGIGGLGHLGVMFASKLQNGTAKVTAISHNSKKKEDALKMGATDFIDTSDAAQVKAAFRKFDFVLVTANGSSMDWGHWLTMVKLGCTLCTVGLPEEPVKLHIFSLLSAQIKITASGIGSIGEIKSMLEFAEKHNIRPIIEKMPMAQANEGLKKVIEGSVRYRVVLENPTQ